MNSSTPCDKNDGFDRRLADFIKTYEATAPHATVKIALTADDMYKLAKAFPSTERATKPGETPRMDAQLAILKDERDPNLIFAMFETVGKQLERQLIEMGLECDYWQTRASDAEDELSDPSPSSKRETAKQLFDKHIAEDTTPIERLRFFCSNAMNGQDWIDVEPFFAALKIAPSAETPRAWIRETEGGYSFKAQRPGDEHNWTPLYTAPSATKPIPLATGDSAKCGWTIDTAFLEIVCEKAGEKYHKPSDESAEAVICALLDLNYALSDGGSAK